MRLQWEVRPGRGAPGGLWGKQGSTGRVGRLRVSQDEQTSSKTQLSIQFQQEGWGSHLSVVSSLIVSDINNLVATKQCHCLSIFLFWIEKCQRLENSHYYPQGYFCFEWKKKKERECDPWLISWLCPQGFKTFGYLCFKGKSKRTMVCEVRYRQVCVLGASE